MNTHENIDDKFDEYESYYSTKRVLMKINYISIHLKAE